MAKTATSKTVKNIPNSEKTKVTCFTESNESGDKYVIGQNSLKGQFTLWKSLGNGFEKVATSNNPSDFDKIIPYKK